MRTPTTFFALALATLTAWGAAPPTSKIPGALQVGTLTVANLPATNVVGTRVYCTDTITPRGTGAMVEWNGTNWLTLAGTIATTDMRAYMVSASSSPNVWSTPWEWTLNRDAVPGANNYLGWIISTAAGGSASTLATGSKVYLQLTTGSTTTTGLCWVVGNTFSWATNDWIGMEAACQYQSAPNGTENWYSFIGASQSATSIGVRAIGFLYDLYQGLGFTNTVTNNWYALTRSGSVNQLVDTGIPFEAGVFHNFLVVGSHAAIYFYIDGVAVATNTLNIETASTLNQNGVGIAKTLGTTSRYVIIDSGQRQHFRYASPRRFVSSIADYDPPALTNVMAINLRPSIAGSDLSATDSTATGSWQIFVSDTYSDIRLCYANLYRLAAAAPTIYPGTNAVTVQASIVKNGAVHPATWGGAISTNLAGGAVAFSDPIPTTLHPWDTVFVRTYFDCTGGAVPTPCLYGGSTATGGPFGSDSYTAGANHAFDTVALATSTFAQKFGPLAVYGTPNSATVPRSVYLVGDSIMSGKGVDGRGFGATLPTNGLSFAHLALQRASIPFATTSCGGEWSATWLTNHAMRFRLLTNTAFNATFSDAIVNYGINDVNTGGGNGSLATVQTNLIATWQALRSNGVSRVFQTTLSPFTASTNYWLSNQSIGDATTESRRLALNAWLRDSSASGAIATGWLAGVFDTASLVETNGGLWTLTNSPAYTGTVTATNATSFSDSALTLPAWTANSQGVIRFTSGNLSNFVMQAGNQNPATTITTPGGTNWVTAPSLGSAWQLWIAPVADGIHPGNYANSQLSLGIDTTQL